MFEDLNDSIDDSPEGSARNTTTATIFEVEPGDLVAMMRAEKPQAITKLKAFKGQKGLCTLLHTNRKRGKTNENNITRSSLQFMLSLLIC